MDLNPKLEHPSPFRMKIMSHGLYRNGASLLSYIMCCFLPHGTRERFVLYLIISQQTWRAQPITVPETQRAWTPANQILMPNVIDFITFFPFSGVTSRARISLGARQGSVGQTARNRLKIGPRREGTVSNGLPVTPHGRLRSGVDLSGARRGGSIATLKVHHYLLKVQQNCKNDINFAENLARSFFLGKACYCGLCREQPDVDPARRRHGTRRAQCRSQPWCRPSQDDFALVDISPTISTDGGPTAP